MKTVTLPQKPIPVIAETDVLVVGSGPGGLAAAVSLKTGKSTADVCVTDVQTELKRQGVRIV